MPLIDAHTHADWSPGQHDVVIVGAGAAGLYLASLLSRRFRVLVIESGDFLVDPATQQLNVVESTGKRLLSAVNGRKRAVGGTTVAWGGQSLPFSAIDFEHRDWVHRSGWPIDDTVLARHYLNANRAMGIDNLDYDGDVFRSLGIRPPAFDSRLIRFHFSKWAPEPNFRRIFARQIEEAFTVIYNCSLVDLDFDGPRIRAAVCRDRAGLTRRFPCDRIVISTGGLETNRILLWLQAKHGFLTTRQSDVLGTGFMEHPCMDAGIVTAPDAYALQRRFNTQVHKRRKYSLRVSAADAWQRKHRLLNASTALTMRDDAEPFDPYAEFRDFSNLWSKRGRYAQTAISLGATAMALLRHRFVYKRGAVATLCICVEQAPTDASRLRLADSTDALGMPRLSINWQISRPTWDTVVGFLAVVRSEFARLGLGDVALRPELIDAQEPRWDLLHDIGHHMGGTVMGDSEDASITDPELRIRGLANAWACSASVFPTGSHSNPTLTVLALADRLAESLLTRQ